MTSAPRSPLQDIRSKITSYFKGDDTTSHGNSAFVFIKPHANTEKVQELVRSTLQAKGLKIVKEGPISAEEINEKKLIDQHYYSIASKATILKPAQLNVPADKFKEQFGLEWTEALAQGNVYNAMDACEKLGISADEMDKQWGICKKSKKLVKFGGGFYCGLVEIEGKEPVYAFNGFFMSMREKFVVPGESIYTFFVEWSSDDLSWADFRGSVLGPTDPKEAPEGSLRGMVLADWEGLGLKAEPDTGDNAVHASASPFEAAAERNNWSQVPFAEDAFGKVLLQSGLPESVLKEWSVDPQVKKDATSKGSLFDQVEDMDAAECTAKLMELYQLNQPEADCDSSVPLTPTKAKAESFTVDALKEGDAKTIGVAVGVTAAVAAIAIRVLSPSK